VPQRGAGRSGGKHRSSAGRKSLPTVQRSAAARMRRFPALANDEPFRLWGNPRHCTGLRSYCVRVEYRNSRHL
jgi:hypothetical protein